MFTHPRKTPVAASKTPDFDGRRPVFVPTAPKKTKPAQVHLRKHDHSQDVFKTPCRRQLLSSKSIKLSFKSPLLQNSQATTPGHSPGQLLRKFSQISNNSTPPATPQQGCNDTNQDDAMRWITSQDETSAGNEGTDGAQTQHDAIHDVSNPPEVNSAQCMAPVSPMFSSVIQRSSCSKKAEAFDWPVSPKRVKKVSRRKYPTCADNGAVKQFVLKTLRRIREDLAVMRERRRTISRISNIPSCLLPARRDENDFNETASISLNANTTRMKLNSHGSNYLKCRSVVVQGNALEKVEA